MAGKPGGEGKTVTVRKIKVVMGNVEFRNVIRNSCFFFFFFQQVVILVG